MAVILRSSLLPLQELCDILDCHIAPGPIAPQARLLRKELAMAILSSYLVCNRKGAVRRKLPVCFTFGLLA